MTLFQKKLWIGLIIMALLSPLGIILPEMLNAGDAWGEWGTDTLEKLIGYIPQGLKKLADIWNAPIADYNFGSDDASLAVQIISYIASGVIGIVIMAAIIFAASKFLIRRAQ